MTKTLLKKLLMVTTAVLALGAAAGCSAHAGYDVGEPSYVVVGD
jgi:hypothetical protein